MNTKRRPYKRKLITLLIAAAGIVITGFLTQFGQNVANRIAALPRSTGESPTPTNVSRLPPNTTTRKHPPQDPPLATPNAQEPQHNEEATMSPREEQSQAKVEVTLMLDSKAPSTTINIDGKPATILKSGLTYITIIAPIGPHTFTLYRRDGYLCNLTQAIEASTTSITPTCIWEKHQ